MGILVGFLTAAGYFIVLSVVAMVITRTTIDD